MAAYGETSGLLPQLKDPHGKVYDSQNWDESSSEQLALARTYIGIVSERNPRVHFATPKNPDNFLETRTWDKTVDSAIAGEDHTKLDPKITNFFLRQEGVGDQRPKKWYANLKRKFSLGPFNNVGGGDAPRGTKTYIDFYGVD